METFYLYTEIDEKSKQFHNIYNKLLAFIYLNIHDIYFHNFS